MKILNREWEEIQDMQQRKQTNNYIKHIEIREPTEEEWGLFRKYGIEGLRELQFFGTIEVIENYWRLFNK